jgi:hypothetical protein
MVFSTFAMVHFFLVPAESTFFNIFANLHATAHHFLLITLVLYFGDSTTREAEKTVEVLGKFASELELSVTEKSNFVFLMSQVKSRKVVVENSFFKVSWSVLVTVRDKHLKFR